MDAPTITLAGREYALVSPSPLTAAVLARTVEDLERPGIGAALGAAALRACWPPRVGWPGGSLPRAWRPGQPVEAHGHQVFDALVSAGASIGEVIRAGNAAYAWAMQSIITEREVAETEVFSGAPEEGAD